MLQYLSVYKKLIKLNFVAWLIYRGNFINSLVGSSVWGIFHFVSIIILTSKVSSVYGWTRDELIMLAASFSFMWGFFHLFFARNFEEIAEIINRGDLDRYLLKPLDSQFLLSVYYINFSGFIRTIFGSIVLIYFLVVKNSQVSIINIISFLVLTICGLILIYSIWFLLATLIIWFPRLTNLVEFLYYISGISRYPPEIVKELSVFTFIFLLPLIIFVSTPTKALLNKLFYGDVFELVFFMILLLLASRWFWKFALRYYTSASS